MEPKAELKGRCAMNYPIDPNMTWTKLLLYFGIIAAVFVFILIRIVYRTRSMKRFAIEHEFRWLGKEIPEGMHLRKTSFAWRDTKVSNSIVGHLRGNEVAVFDVAYDLPKEAGRQARTVHQTVIAFRNAGELRCSDTPSTGDSKSHLETAGDWIIAYTEKKLISVSKLDERCVEGYAQAVVIIQRLPSLRNA
jgi:hypothetical protein